MPSLDFDAEKSVFRDFYNANFQRLDEAKNSFITLIKSLTTHAGTAAISKIEGRVKDREECIKKFNLKYRTILESKSQFYEIKDHVTDLIGLRIVCLYEDDIEKVRTCLAEHFSVIEITDKIAQIENTEGSFGYKGLHLDLRLDDARKLLPEYKIYGDYQFEIQIRTIIQDSWSVLDHKIKYKKSIPTILKRRINTLAALFELADREFREIRNSTIEEMKKEEVSEQELLEEENFAQQPQRDQTPRYVKLNAFSLLKIAKHFFSGYDFEPHKIDGFAQEILDAHSTLSRGKFNFYLKDNISRVKKYQSDFEKLNQNDKLNPYTIMRHCLYLGNKDKFPSILTNVSKENFERWLEGN